MGQWAETWLSDRPMPVRSAADPIGRAGPADALQEPRLVADDDEYWQPAAWNPARPNVAMRRTADHPREPGDFWFMLRGTGDQSRIYTGIERHEGKRPSHLHFINNRGEHHMVAIRPVVQDNGASWEWDGNWDQPTLTPSIHSHATFKGQNYTLWHGFVTKGVAGFEC